MPAATPPAAIMAEYLKPVRRITRRVEIYEQDGVTPWKGATGDSDMVTGSVSVDYSRDERRTLELTLDNRDGTYSPDPGGFWYDKIIKVYRGLDIPRTRTPPRILIIEDNGGNNFTTLVNMLKTAGYYNIRYLVTAPGISDVQDSDIIVAISGMNAPSQSALINQAWASGKTIFTMGQAVQASTYPTILSTTNALAANSAQSITKAIATVRPELSTPNWSAFSGNYSINAGYTIGAVKAGVSIDGTNSAGAPDAVSYQYNNKKWAHLQISQLPPNDSATGQATALIGAIFRWLDPKLTVTNWELQIGEFMVDSIDQPRFPRQVMITGRDYTKKLMGAGFTVTTAYGTAVSAELTIRDIAINGGINPAKIIIPSVRQSMGISQTFERGTTRWDAIKQIAEAFNLEVYFDNIGTLIVRPFNDPTTDNPVFVFTSGMLSTATLTDFTMSSGSSGIYNQIVVSGESSDKTKIPVWAVANNTNPASPSNQNELGIVTYFYSSPAMTTTAQCQALAKKYLTIYALEEFAMSWSAMCLDWLEAGDIVDVKPDPEDYRKPDPNVPTRFLLTSFEIPLDLGPMSANGKRVLVVN
jgi:hypothetical protein